MLASGSSSRSADTTRRGLRFAAAAILAFGFRIFGAEPDFSVTVSPSVVSQYMYRGERLGGPSFQASVEADGKDFGLGVWASEPLADKVAGQSDPEIDPYGYWRDKIDDETALIPGFEIYTYPGANGSGIGPGFSRTRPEANVGLEHRFGSFTLMPRIAYDFRLKGADFELNGYYGVPLASIGSELDFAATVGAFDYSDALNGASPAARETAEYVSAGAKLPFQISPSSKLSVGWAYEDGFNDYFRQAGLPKAYNRLAGGRSVVSVSFAWTF